MDFGGEHLLCSPTVAQRPLTHCACDSHFAVSTSLVHVPVVLSQCCDAQFAFSLQSSASRSALHVWATASQLRVAHMVLPVHGDVVGSVPLQVGVADVVLQYPVEHMASYVHGSSSDRVSPHFA